MIKTAKKKKAAKGKGFKIKAMPLSEEQITLFVKHYKQFKAFPGSKIPCTITGKLTTCVGPWMLKKIKQFGSAESLLRNYKCRGAIKDQKIKTKPVKIKHKKKTKEIMKPRCLPARGQLSTLSLKNPPQNLLKN